MTSLINILLKNSTLAQQNQASDLSNVSTLQKDSKFSPYLLQTTNIIYALIFKEKYQLLETIMKNLKKQEEVYNEKLGKQGEIKGKSKVPKPQILHQELINRLSLVDSVLKLGSTIESKEKDGQMIKIVDQLTENNILKVINIVQLFVNHVFSARSISKDEIALMELIIESLNTEKFDEATKFIEKWKIVLQLTKGPQNTNNLQKTEQKTRKQKENWLFIESTKNYSSENLSLVQIFKQVTATPEPVSTILSLLIKLSNTVSLEAILSQLNDSFKLMSPNFKFQFSMEIQESIANLIELSKTQWAKVRFLETAIQYFFHELSSKIVQYEEKQEFNVLESQIKNLESIVQTLSGVYSDFLRFINQNILQEWVQNDLKNNYYLSETSKKTYVINLLELGLWISGSPQIRNYQKQQKQQYLLDFIVKKSLNFTDCSNKQIGKHIFKEISIIKDEITKIALFLSLNQRENLQNRLLSHGEYQDRLKSALNEISQAKGKNQENSFSFWFLSEHFTKSVHKNVKFENPQKFVELSFQKLHQNILQNITIADKAKSFSQFLIEKILGLSSNTQKQFLQQTFQFYSPTFNQQYLTFNYIYGDTKDSYFYQNHHYSHVLIIIYQTLIKPFIKDLPSKPHNQPFMLTIFNHLRNFMGNYAKQHLVQANSKPFYEYLNLFKFAHLTFTRELLNIVSIDELIITFDLILTQIIIKENHPLIRQYIEILMARIYFTLKERIFAQNFLAKSTNEDIESSDYLQKAQSFKKNVRKFHSCRTRMINMLEYDQENLHNLNIGVPILMILGYELISCVEEQNFTTNQLPIEDFFKPEELQKSDDSASQRPIHELDIHYILIKYIACHVAYSRAICQYYMSKFLQLRKNNLKITNDTLLESLSHFWYADKDSINIMKNISVAVQGFKLQVDSYLKGESIQEFYLGFERVEEHPQFESSYFLLRDTINIYEKIVNDENGQIHFDFKLLMSEKLSSLKEKALQLEREKVKQIYESTVHKDISQQQKPKKTDKKKDKKHLKDNKKSKHKLQGSKETQVKAQIEEQQIQQQTQNQIFAQLSVKLSKKLQKKYFQYQELSEPKVIIIATLLQKVHNFGYLVRTLTSHKAMLVVPSATPFLHPQCKELLPDQQDIDVKVIEIKPKQLESFIKMYQYRGYPLIALEQCSKSIELQKTVFPEKYMLLLGNERIGAPASLLSMADILVEIPQIGKVRSLNVHVSMVICFWEYLKQVNQNRQQKQNQNQQISKN